MTYPSELHAEIRRLHFAEHWRVDTIATQLDIHPDVVRLACSLTDRKEPPPRETLLDPYKSLIKKVLEKYPTLRATRLKGMLTQRGYTGSIRTLRNHVKQVRPKPTPTASLRIETLPAEQAQVDWAHICKLPFGNSYRSLWLFVFVLSYSRAMWGEFVLDLGAASLHRSMVRALSFFGGCPRTWLFDNPKSIAVARHGKAVRFHPGLLGLADAYRAEPRVCAVRAPNQKGKVERLIRYLRDAFLVGREIGSVAQGNRELLQFISTTANVRPHPVRMGETVAQALEHEKRLLLPLPDVPPPTDQLTSCRVTRDGFVWFDTNSYSVPAKLVGKTVTVAASDTHIRVVELDKCHAEHERRWGKRQRIEKDEHRRELLAQRQAARPARGQDRLRTVAPAIDQLFERWIREGRNIGSLTAKSLKLLDLYGDELFAAAVGTVNDRGTHDIGALAVVCEQLRQAAARPVPIALDVKGPIPDNDVIPHDMETYDDVSKNNED